MDDILTILRGLASRNYRFSRLMVPRALVFHLIERNLNVLKSYIEQTCDDTYINFSSIQGRSDHSKKLKIIKLNKRQRLFFKQFNKKNIFRHKWHLNEVLYILTAIKSTQAAIPYYREYRDIKALTVYHNPELFLLKSIFGTKLICYDHGARLTSINQQPNFPMVAGCDILNIFYKEDCPHAIESFSLFGLRLPIIAFEKSYDIKSSTATKYKRIIYLQTVYKPINPAFELIKLRFYHPNVRFRLHPRLSSNYIKVVFYKILDTFLQRRDFDTTYRSDTLYLSNGSTALLEAKKKGCAVAFFSPTISLKNPYPKYMNIYDYEN